MQTCLDGLLTENNISGFWTVVGAVIGAFVTFISVFLNNFFENRRKVKEQKRATTLEAYTNALRYLSLTQKNLLQAGAGHIDDIKDIDSSHTENFYKVLLFSSRMVAGKFLEISEQTSSLFLSLANCILDIKETRSQIDCEKSIQQINNRSIEKILKDMEAFNRSQSQDGDRFLFMRSQFDDLKCKNDEILLKIDVLQQNDARMCLELLRKVFGAVNNISPLVFEVILLMRNDLESCLSKKDSKFIQDSLAGMNEKMKRDIDKFIEDLEMRINRIASSVSE